MKHIKKFYSVLVAFVMAFTMSTTIFAADTTITAPAGSTRTYDVYQIFTGDLSDGVLSNVKWGKNGQGTKGEAVPDATTKALEAVNSLSDTKKLEKIKEFVNLDSEKFGTVSDGSPLNAPTGYYLIKDNGPVGDGEAYSLYVVQVVGPTTISPKVGTVTSEKKVDDKNDSNTTEDAVVWQDSADYDIGDDVPFQLKATIAQDYDNYKVYKLTFHDKESAGLTFKPETVVVKIDGATVDKSNYSVVTTGLTDGDTFEVRFADLKSTAAKAGSVITVEYSSTLNDQAVLGSTGNPNTMHVTYSNNPNDAQGGENGKTPDDTVIVFTYKVVVNKVDEKKDPLKGAGFTLYKKNASGEYVVVGSEVKGDDMTTFEWSGLDDGDYKLVETTTPAGYNTIADIEFTISAEHDVLSDNPALTSLSGGNKFTGVVDTGTVSTNVENKKGATLPETGGIGTTMFYVAGAGLVLVAVVLLITRKRMN
ncbi:isopeptide-forming domain-containing fimbrial protein [Floccifex sp.]|uniref:isopeptide-forming domain-containing fimbrial protein n=1 Tax=Floccifex sp. TaxID=2815810 RepID=UPI002A75369F|nr:isopeptide-forming domain-containing fimbrial protein [Floccifex sp.]MDD7282237.1 isopeptide-forming domain-containing fimbrial protein [Erysipelotrichaceae bacterium]MDY2957762.1 isopeptide-forming domain-containing fimbrial protein [Floccifex sp.]